MPRTDYEALGGHMDQVRALSEVVKEEGKKRVAG